MVYILTVLLWVDGKITGKECTAVYAIGFGLSCIGVLLICVSDAIKAKK